MSGRFVVKAELPGATRQILVPSGRTLASGNSIMAKLNLGLRLEAPVGRFCELWLDSDLTPLPRMRRGP